MAVCSELAIEVEIRREVLYSLQNECVVVDGGPTGFHVAPISQAAARLYANLVHGDESRWVL